MQIIKNINPNIFREYDIRAIYGEDLNEDVAYTLGKAFGSYARDFGETKVIIGHDNRSSYTELYPALREGLLDSGIDVLSLGFVTTPMHNFAKIYYDVNAAIMVTASHNPKEYNGFKLSLLKDDSLYGDSLREFKKYFDKYKFYNGRGILTEDDVTLPYLHELKKSINLGSRRVKVVVDLGNGTGSLFMRQALDMFNIDYKILYGESDSSFPNHTPDPAVKSNMISLGEKVRELSYDVGLAVDGDCDRCGMVLEDGTYIAADMMMLIFYRDLASSMSVKKGVFDVKCSLSLSDEIEKLGLEVCMNRTGSVYCRNYVKENNLSFGGEYSGHLFFRDRYLGYDDGFYGVLRMIEILSKTDKKASELLSGINHYYSTEELMVKVTDDNKFDIVKGIKKYALSKNYKISDIDGVRVILDGAFALVRASNTSPNLTLRFEAKTQEECDKLQKEFMDKVNELSLKGRLF